MALPEKQQSTYIGATNWAALQKKHHPDALSYATTKTADGNRMWRSDRKISDFKHTKPESLKQTAAIKLREKTSPKKETTAPASSTVKQEAAKNLRTANKAVTMWNPDEKDTVKKAFKQGQEIPKGYKLWTGGSASVQAAKDAIYKKKNKKDEEEEKK